MDILNKKQSALADIEALDMIKDNEKYLGVYFNRDLDTYLTYLDEEIKTRIKRLVDRLGYELYDCPQDKLDKS